MEQTRVEGLRREPRAQAASLGLPSGWFVVATSAELARGATLTRAFMSEDIVLYRTASGEARAVTPYCPHLGAHLGHTGAVEGETIRCAFHGFCFDRGGACVKTGYGKRPPAAARLPVRELRERDGLLLAWYDPTSLRPAWEVPPLDGEGWTPFVIQRLDLRGHPQETSENSVDLGHLTTVHGFRRVELLDGPHLDGPHLRARYTMEHPAVPGLDLGLYVRASFDVAVHGLGFSRVEVSMPDLGLEARQLVLSTPTEPGRIALRLGTSLRTRRDFGALGRAALRGLSRIAAVVFRHDVLQDFTIWENKRYVPRPALAAGDGPIGLYRKWAAQFYPSAA